MIESPYRRGAHDGVTFGVYLTAMFFFSIFSPVLPLLSVAALLMMAAVPVVTFLYLRRYQRDLGVASSFSALWMQGLVIFACGMLLCGLVLAVYMTWLNPSFLTDQLASLAAVKGTMPDTGIDEAALVAERLLENKAVPRPIQVIIQLEMLAIVTGSFL
ncbi:MAG: DUF4199 domain-containing protein [Duncaniella sp.]|nr:DUF4199 domain-containing protein [Duncaniella sp.]